MNRAVLAVEIIVMEMYLAVCHGIGVKVILNGIVVESHILVIAGPVPRPRFILRTCYEERRVGHKVTITHAEYVIDKLVPDSKPIKGLAVFQLHGEVIVILAEESAKVQSARARIVYHKFVFKVILHASIRLQDAGRRFQRHSIYCTVVIIGHTCYFK